MNRHYQRKQEDKVSCLRTKSEESALKRIKRMNSQNNHECEVADYIRLESESCEPLLAQPTPISVVDTGLSPEQTFSNGNNSDDKTDDFKYKDFIPLLVDHTSNGFSTSKEFDIAASSNKEVKISLNFSFSRNLSFQSQNLIAVIGEVEDECLSKYKIPDFSLIKLLETVCERFLVVNANTNAINVLQNAQNSLIPSHFKEMEKMKKVKLPKIVKSSKLHSKEAVKPKKYPIYVDDISRGEESVEIPIVNEYGDVELPNFLYIKENMVHKDAHVDFSLARISDDNYCANCCGDCVSAALPCACAGETRGEFAYTMDGLVEEEFLEECIGLSRQPQRKYFYYCDICPLQNDPHQRKGRRIKPCKGHLSRRFIKECWTKCGCSKWCRNRVVQNGIQVPLQVFATPEGKGWGVRCVNSLKKGSFVCEYIGEIVTNLELYDRNKERAIKQEKHTYPVLLDADWGSERILKDEEALCLDATEFGNVGRFVNHRCCDSNLIEIPVEIETPDHHYYHLAFFTSKDIKPMEELTWDYGIEFEDKNHPIKAFNCKCGSKSCRDRI
ncbi:histone-lysine N-methyltransferase SUVR4-like isoform X1 [Euphorbia lathyris]|uniref:histone-lysine N-methyltransferase SUVR4-like isoform X1 n=1 Tax=Euphorbia lathyris TaxID=212925 RepID=UPI0033138DBF